MTVMELEDIPARFREYGFLGPVPIFSAAQCRLIMSYLRDPEPKPVPEWEKSRATVERFFFNLATRPHLLDVLRTLIGNDIILWGAQVLEREPGQVHPWHSDIESSAR